MTSNQRFRIGLLALLLGTGCLPHTTRSVHAKVVSSNEDILAQQFLNPPGTARPAVYGFTFGEASDAVITRDLEQMKTKGVTACLIYSLGPRAGTVPPGQPTAPLRPAGACYPAGYCSGCMANRDKMRIASCLPSVSLPGCLLF